MYFCVSKPSPGCRLHEAETSSRLTNGSCAMSLKGSVMVWGCISHDCKLDLVAIQGNPTGDQYIRNVLQPVAVPHFDSHQTSSRLTNGSCAMSLNSNHLVLSTMPNMIVDVGLPTVDV
jgi:hypothetical protein